MGCSKDRALADLMVQQGWITSTERLEIERGVQRKLKRWSGDIHATLASLLDPSVRRVLIDIDDSTIHESLAFVSSAFGGGQTVSFEASRGERSRYVLTRLYGQGGLGRVWPKCSKRRIG
jgi:hypothetical protein